MVTVCVYGYKPIISEEIFERCAELLRIFYKISFFPI